MKISAEAHDEVAAILAEAYDEIASVLVAAAERLEREARRKRAEK